MPTKSKARVRGTRKTRRTIQKIANRILDETSKSTVEEGAKRLGLVNHDIKNLRAGNLPSLQLVLRLIAKGRYSPEALIRDGQLKKLPKSASTRPAQQRLISGRIRKLAKEQEAASLVKATGLSIYHIYQLRVGNKPAGIHTVLGFIDAGSSPDEIFFGR